MATINNHGLSGSLTGGPMPTPRPKPITGGPMPTPRPKPITGGPMPTPRPKPIIGAAPVRVTKPTMGATAQPSTNLRRSQASQEFARPGKPGMSAVRRPQPSVTPRPKPKLY